MVRGATNRGGGCVMLRQHQRGDQRACVWPSRVRLRAGPRALPPQPMLREHRRVWGRLAIPHAELDSDPRRSMLDDQRAGRCWLGISEMLSARGDAGRASARCSARRSMLGGHQRDAQRARIEPPPVRLRADPHTLRPSSMPREHPAGWSRFMGSTSSGSPAPTWRTAPADEFRVPAISGRPAPTICIRGEKPAATPRTRIDGSETSAPRGHAGR